MEWLRAGIFLLGFTIFFLWGHFFPLRRVDKKDKIRWWNNIVLAAFNTICIKILLGSFLIYVVQGEDTGAIRFFDFSSFPLWLDILLSIFILDLVIYWQHRFFHTLPLLWRLHRVHHTDTSYDSTTALRFHTLEILFSLLLKAGVVGFFGVSIWSVVIFEALLNFSAMFNHGNFSLTFRWDKVLRLMVVTPDYHRIHHSSRIGEINSNYGFCMTFWDYIFGTYRSTSIEGQRDMRIGLNSFRDIKDQKFFRLLIQPFL